MSPKAGEPTRAEILAAASALFAEHGYDGTSLRAIARASGVSQPLIHHHFGSKDELWSQVLASIVESFASAQAPQFELGEGSEEFLERGLDALLRWYQEDPDRIRLGLWAQVRSDTTTWKEQAEQFARFAEFLGDASSKGVVRSDVPPFHLAMAISGMAYYWFAFKARYAAAGGVDPEDPRADRAFFESLRTLLSAPPAPGDAARSTSR